MVHKLHIAHVTSYRLADLPEMYVYTDIFQMIRENSAPPWGVATHILINYAVDNMLIDLVTLRMIFSMLMFRAF
jgi:hypothetical protein